MTDPANFLSRWSRRKREARPEPENNGGGVESSTHSEQRPDSELSAVPAASPVPDAAAASSEPVCDLESLPPIESIGAETDISAFMRKGVPTALRNAALRRAWSADPGIRDFMGPNENYWDAAGPDGIPGFGDLDPGFDVKRLVAELFGEAKPEQAKPETSTLAGASGPIPEISETPPEDTLRTAANVAPQQQKPPPTPAKKIVRRHGGAKPE
jgi:hypothetical protein